MASAAVNRGYSGRSIVASGGRLFTRAMMSRSASRRSAGVTVPAASRAASAHISAVIKAKSFTIDGEAVVLGPDGLSRFDELRRREAALTAILYAFDLIEHDGQDMRNRPFLDRKAAL